MGKRVVAHLCYKFGHGITGGGIEFLIFHFFASPSRFTTFYSNYNVLQRIKRDVIKRCKTL